MSAHKPEIRRELRRARQSLPHALAVQCAHAVAAQAWQLPQLRRARCVALYLSVGSELETGPLIQQLWQAGVQVCVPRIRNTQLHWIRLNPATRLRKNRHGIAEPVGGTRLRLSQIDVLFLPLLGFDSEGTRLGAGGGYYDRALAPLRERARPLRVGYAYSIQQISHLPREAWDIPLHAAVTEFGVFLWPTG